MDRPSRWSFPSDEPYRDELYRFPSPPSPRRRAFLAHVRSMYEEPAVANGSMSQPQVATRGMKHHVAPLLENPYKHHQRYIPTASKPMIQEESLRAIPGSFQQVPTTAEDEANASKLPSLKWPLTWGYVPSTTPGTAGKALAPIHQETKSVYMPPLKKASEHQAQGSTEPTRADSRLELRHRKKSAMGCPRPDTEVTAEAVRPGDKEATKLSETTDTENDMEVPRRMGLYIPKVELTQPNKSESPSYKYLSTAGKDAFANYVEREKAWQKYMYLDSTAFGKLPKRPGTPNAKPELLPTRGVSSQLQDGLNMLDDILEPGNAYKNCTVGSPIVKEPAAPAKAKSSEQVTEGQRDQVKTNQFGVYEKRAELAKQFHEKRLSAANRRTTSIGQPTMSEQETGAQHAQDKGSQRRKEEVDQSLKKSADKHRVIKSPAGRLFATDQVARSGTKDKWLAVKSPKQEEEKASKDNFEVVSLSSDEEDGWERVGGVEDEWEFVEN
ncbi:hypothetical protein EJ02DRAFT_78246 [Clathrospora elynae]|uniref:Uncharacterized protein n=1 Tax=Clathrospora elynae TaxID=706981 RepID=A0A6A5SYH6_9PLEO|nr:hypothetical protein EJ02DRAFT_78246 [Clathrospora elynae]